MTKTPSTVYLIPTVLDEGPEALQALPAYILPAIRQCSVFFVENEKTARRFFKVLWKEMVIDDYRWHTIHKAEPQVQQQLENYLRQGKNIGIVSEAGCPCIADPGQLLVGVAQRLKAKVTPLVGPSSILLALMASGMNGQKFAFHGYLPIETAERRKALRQLESDSLRDACTQLFIETPYRNNQLLKEILTSCRDTTRLCIAAHLTGKDEQIVTQTVKEWKQAGADYHKKPVIFLLYAGS
jgi:16S rRNA (cytidine1402-2'-O)-methyltransferase